MLRGRTFHPDILSTNVVKSMCDLLRFQGWGDLFLDITLLVHEQEVVEFYTNLSVLEGHIVTSTVNGVEIIFDPIRLGEILQVLKMELVNIIGLLMNIVPLL